MRIVAESESESSESEKSKRTLGVCLSVSLYLVCYLEKKNTDLLRSYQFLLCRSLSTD